MTDDYAAVIRDRQVTVAEHDGAIVGVVVLTVTDEGFLVDNVAVHPSRRGTGLGRALLQFAEAEARRVGFDAIHLYTHEQMRRTSRSTRGSATWSTTGARRARSRWST
jgi:N-acetylglutamate synthase-like GNAT family acetyltransferase